MSNSDLQDDSGDIAQFTKSFLIESKNAACSNVVALVTRSIQWKKDLGSMLDSRHSDTNSTISIFWHK